MAKLLPYLKSLFAASELPAVAPPKVRPGSRSMPSFLRSTKINDSILPETDRRLATVDTTTYRFGNSSKAVVRDFVSASPDLSAAMWAYARMAIPSGYHVIATNLDGSFNREATLLAQQLATRFDMLPDYAEDGFTGTTSIKSVSESLVRDLMLNGSLSGEVILGKDRLPRRVMPISTTQVKFKAGKDKKLIPVQMIGSDEIDLDYPTFIYVALDQDLLEPYSSSPFESAIKPAVFSEDFFADVHRILKKVIHPRQKVKLDEAKLRQHLSPEASRDESLAISELNSIIADIESKLNSLRPEEALVYLDSMGFEVETPSNGGLSAEYETLQNIANGRLAAGSKTLGTILGHSKGSSNIASTEAMLFQKSATAVKGKLDEFWSRVFTVSIRLFGLDVVVRFKFDDVDLRPEADLAAFRQTQQMMILEQLSLGLISDEEASLRLNGSLPPIGYKPLSGTHFKNPNSAVNKVENPSNSGSALNQNLNGDTPSTGRGQNKKAELIVI